jgi:hypothetical protein
VGCVRWFLSQADDFKLSNNQKFPARLGPQLNTATCKSYAYLFNIKTGIFQCRSAGADARQQEVINVQTDGGCTKNAS